MEYSREEINEMMMQLASLLARRNEAMRAMREGGSTLEEIGRTFGMTKQRVWQIVGKKSPRREVVDTASS